MLCEAFLEEEGDFLRFGEAVALGEDLVVVGLHLDEEGLVDAVHDAGGEEGFEVFWREEVAGFLVEAQGAVGLEGHELLEAVIMALGGEVGFGDAEFCEFGEGEVDAVSVLEVFLDVAEDVGELEGVAEGDGVVSGALDISSEEGEADEADGGGDAVAVALEVFPGLEALGGEVHFAAFDDIDEVLAGDGVEVADGEDFPLEVGEAEGGVGLAGGEDVFPPGEAFFLLFEGEVEVVGEVIDDAAVGVEGDEVGAALGGDAAEGEGEI